MGITQKTEAIGMYSAEGEFVEFGHSVLLEGPVEVCLFFIHSKTKQWLRKLYNLNVKVHDVIHELLTNGEYNALLMYPIGMAVWCWTEYALDTQGTAETM